MSDWGEGYVSDIEYTTGFYHEQAPARIAFACLLNGVAPPRWTGAYSYLELGCGRGFTLNLLAAANPEARFVGIDFMPGHIVEARRLAAAVGLDNVTFLETSFEEALADRDALPEFDLITQHGVYSWVSAANRQAIVDLIRAKLKPGGAAYLSYNAMPGWATTLPVQRLIRDVAGQHVERSDRAVARAIRYMQELHEAGAVTLANAPMLPDLVKSVDSGFTTYLAHEYLNAHWEPQYFTDVARDLAGAKLQFAARANILEAFPELIYTGEQRALLGRVSLPIQQQQLQDYILGTRFRRDIFIRGIQHLSMAERQARLLAVPLAMTVARKTVSLTLRVPAGEANMSPDTYNAVFDAIDGPPRPFIAVYEALQAHFAPRPVPAQVVELIGMAVGTQQCAPVVPSPSRAAIERCAAFNRELANATYRNPVNQLVAFASPLLGSGIAADLGDALVFHGLIHGVPAEVEPLAQHYWRPIQARGETMMKEGKPVSSEAENLALIREQVGKILEKYLPAWRQHHLLPE